MNVTAVMTSHHVTLRSSVVARNNVPITVTAIEGNVSNPVTVIPSVPLVARDPQFPRTDRDERQGVASWWGCYCPDPHCVCVCSSPPSDASQH
ncbi:hypothetical protein Hamer_G001175 [Homarus americanus]|uniref:Uncharacterized protein n=1 Tax=Homarus americanus TaxID=6706 RepID=A0A8J5N8N7_HOMAM|nr:hypothetical protein Hamer_G001175 [Homarus americanus]